MPTPGFEPGYGAPQAPRISELPHVSFRRKSCYLLSPKTKILTEAKKKQQDGGVSILPVFSIVLMLSDRVQEACRNLIVLRFERLSLFITQSFTSLQDDKSLLLDVILLEFCSVVTFPLKSLDFLS